MRKRLLLLTLLISFSVPVVAHNEFNGGVGLAPNFETIQEKRLSLINERYYKAKSALDSKYQALIDEFGSSGSVKKMQLTIKTYENLSFAMEQRFKNKKACIKKRDGEKLMGKS